MMMETDIGRSVWARLVVVAGAFVVVGGGCSRQAEVRLYQPFAPPAQAELKLESSWAYSNVDRGRRAYLLAFPLPEMPDGPRDFMFYFTAPETTGSLGVGGAEASGVRGFFIQAVGALRGKASFQDGVVRVRDPWWAPGHFRKVELEVRCSDGTTIAGEALVEEVAHELRVFEQRYGGDVALLRVDVSAAPAEGKVTSPRPAVEPEPEPED